MKFNDLNIVILAYARPETFSSVLKACERNIKKVKVIIDYPANKEIYKKQEKILQLIDESQITCELVQRRTNHGLIGSVTRAVQEELQLNEHIVLLEDDCLPHDQFFEFMSYSLKKHKTSNSISSVCGTITECPFNPWGWATWREKWDYKNHTQQEILQIKNLDNELRNILKNDKLEKSIWSINWLAKQYEKNMTSVFPKKNLVTNIGINSENCVHNSNTGYTAWLLSKVAKV